jgi:hypothetical protein
MLGKYKWNMQDIWDTMKRPNLGIMGIGEKIKTKGIDNLFNRIISDNFPNLKSHPCLKLIEHQTVTTKEEPPPDTS